MFSFVSHLIFDLPLNSIVGRKNQRVKEYASEIIILLNFVRLTGAFIRQCVFICR